MPDDRNQFDELGRLLDRLFEGQLEADGLKRLEQTLLDNPAALEYYQNYVDVHSLLHWQYAAPEKDLPATPVADAGPADRVSQPAVAPSGISWDWELPAEKPRPKVVIETSPPTPIPWYSVSSPIGLPLISYTLGAIIMLIAIGIGAVVRVSHNYEIAAGQTTTSEEDSGGGGLADALATAEKAKPKKEESPVVGHISGMAGCRWADPSLKPIAPRIRQGAKFALESGLMEITYTTGAKVILQGPCTYEVESPQGGYLALGKLTARVASGEWPVASVQSQANHKSAISKSPNLQISKFTVRTPTALITDLGTEFGVEVFEDGATESHVLQGRVEIKAEACGEDERNCVYLSEGKAMRIEPHGKTFVSVAFVPSRFLRSLRVASDSTVERAYIEHVLADKPLGYWPLNEPAGARRFADRSGNGFHGWAMGNVLTGQAGPFVENSRAIELQGDGYIDIGRQDCFALKSDFTIEAWVWINPQWNSAREPQPGPIISAGSGESRYQRHGWYLACRPRSVLEANGDEMQRLLTMGFYGVENSHFVDWISDRSMPLLQWAHVAFVFDAAHAAQAYINGRASAVLTDCTPPKQGPVWVSIGWHSNLGGQFWKGRLAHVAVFPKALSGQRIQERYHISQQRDNAQDMKRKESLAM